MTKVIARVHPVHLMNVDWAPGGRQPSDQANQLGLWVRWKMAAIIHIHYRHCYYYSARRLILILLSLSAQPVLKTVYRSSCHNKHNCQQRDSNLGPLTPQSDALTTWLLRPALWVSVRAYEEMWKNYYRCLRLCTANLQQSAWQRASGRCRWVHWQTRQTPCQASSSACRVATPPGRQSASCLWSATRPVRSSPCDSAADSARRPGSCSPLFWPCWSTDILCACLTSVHHLRDKPQLDHSSHSVLQKVKQYRFKTEVKDSEF